MFDIILGDFNINVAANNNLQQVMSQYHLINYEPTHVSGSRLYYVYINRQTFQKTSIEAIQKFKLRSL